MGSEMCIRDRSQTDLDRKFADLAGCVADQPRIDALARAISGLSGATNVDALAAALAPPPNAPGL